MTDIPPVELFTKRQSTGPRPVAAFFDSMSIGEPQMLPEPWCSYSKQRMSKQRQDAERRLGCKISLRTYNGKVWAMRLPEED
jgi:hypothetical protein